MPPVVIRGGFFVGIKIAHATNMGQTIRSMKIFCANKTVRSRHESLKQSKCCGDQPAEILRRTTKIRHINIFKKLKNRVSESENEVFKF